jgi:hypothetical protein
MQGSIYTNKLWSATAPVDPNPFSPEVLQVFLANSIRNARATNSRLRVPAIVRYPITDIRMYMAEGPWNRIVKRKARSRLRAPVAIGGFYPFERSIHSRGVGW